MFSSYFIIYLGDWRPWWRTATRGCSGRRPRGGATRGDDGKGSSRSQIIKSLLNYYYYCYYYIVLYYIILYYIVLYCYYIFVSFIDVCNGMLQHVWYREDRRFQCAAEGTGSDPTWLTAPECEALRCVKKIWGDVKHDLHSKSSTKTAPSSLFRWFLLFFRATLSSGSLRSHQRRGWEMDGSEWGENSLPKKMQVPFRRSLRRFNKRFHKVISSLIITLIRSLIRFR